LVSQERNSGFATLSRHKRALEKKWITSESGRSERKMTDQDLEVVLVQGRASVSKPHGGGKPQSYKHCAFTTLATQGKKRRLVGEKEGITSDRRGRKPVVGNTAGRETEEVLWVNLVFSRQKKGFRWVGFLTGKRGKIGGVGGLTCGHD